MKLNGLIDFRTFDDTRGPLNSGSLWKRRTMQIQLVKLMLLLQGLQHEQPSQGMRQGEYELIITYKEQFNSAKKAYQDRGDPVMDNRNVAMDFLEVLF